MSRNFVMTMCDTWGGGVSYVRRVLGPVRLVRGEVTVM